MRAQPDVKCGVYEDEGELDSMHTAQNLQVKGQIATFNIYLKVCIGRRIK